MKRNIILLLLFSTAIPGQEHGNPVRLVAVVYYKTCNLYLCCMKVLSLRLQVLLWILSYASVAGAQFYFGHDLSYVNQMEDCGAVFKEGGLPQDVFAIFADHGTNLVRVRLWHDPSWWQDSLVQPAGVLPHYNDLADVKLTIARAKAAGMQVMLDLHLSDFWADPARQLIPRAWLDVAYDTEILSDSVYQYTAQVLAELDAEGLMPDIVKIGNESNGGILRHIPTPDGFDVQSTVSNNWARHGQLWNAAIQAVREVGATASIDPKIAIHFTNDLDGQVWNFNNLMVNAAVTDFDIIGISYYYAWHEGSIQALQSTIADLVATFPGYEVMVAETGYLWSTQNFDQLNNIIAVPDPEYLPVSPGKQLEYMVDYAHAVKNGGGTGVIFWEPAWVTTPCATPWGTGSSHEHVAFFDPDDDNFIAQGGGSWTEPHWYADPAAVKVTFRVNMQGVDVSQGVFLRGSFPAFSGESLPMMHEGNQIYSTFLYMSPGNEGGYYFLNGPDVDDREIVPSACALWQGTDRRFQIPGQSVVYAYQWATCDTISVPEEVEVVFAVDMTGQDVSNGVYITGNMTGEPWQILPATHLYGQVYAYTQYLPPGSEGAYYFLTTDNWSNYLDHREDVPPPCDIWWNSDRGYAIPPYDTVFAVVWGSCETFELSTAIQNPGTGFEPEIFPNPAEEVLFVRFPVMAFPVDLRVMDVHGRVMSDITANPGASLLSIPLSGLSQGMYWITWRSPEQTGSLAFIH